MKNLVKILLPICGATMSALPLTLVSCNSQEGIWLDNYLPFGPGQAIPELVSKSFQLTQDKEYSCIIDYSKWEEWDDHRPSFMYVGASDIVRPTWIIAQNVWLKQGNEWQKLIKDKDYKIIESIGFLNLVSDFSRKLGHNDQIKIDIVVTKTAEYNFSAR